jgi:hypothetical protein
MSAELAKTCTSGGGITDWLLSLVLQLVCSVQMFEWAYFTTGTILASVEGYIVTDVHNEEGKLLEGQGFNIQRSAFGTEH